MDFLRGNAATGGGARRAAFVAVLAVLALAAAVLGFADDASAQASIFRVGGSVVIRPDEHLVGDVFAVGGTVDVLGSVTGDVVGVGGAVTVDGTVTGDVVALGGSVTLGPDARVFGDVTVVGGMVTRDPQAVVHGEVTSVSVAQTIRSGVNWNIVWWTWPWRDWPLALLYVAGLFAFAALILAWIPDRVHAVERHMETNAGRSAAIGLLALLLLVPLTFVLALTIIGPPLLWIRSSWPPSCWATWPWSASSAAKWPSSFSRIPRPCGSWWQACSWWRCSGTCLSSAGCSRWP